jgi:MFS family permease
MQSANESSAVPPLQGATPAAVAGPAPGARKALMLLLAINLFNYVDRYILAAVEKPIRDEFGVSKEAMGWLVTAFLLTYMVVSPIFGWLADRYSRWVLVGIGVILWSLASGASGLAQTYLFLLFMRCLIGVGEGAYGPVAPTLISDMYPVAIRGKVLAWFYAAIPVGSALGFIVGGLFASADHWHWAFLITIPPGVLLGIFCFRMKEPPRGLSDRAVPSRKARGSDYLTLLKTPSYVLNCLGMTAMTFAIGGIAFWMPGYLIEERGVSEGTASMAFGGIVVVAGLLATISGGMAGDALRARGWGGAYFIVSAAGMTLGFPLMLALLYVDFPYAWGVLFLAVFCLFFNTGPSNTALANVTHPSVRATAYAINIFVVHALGDAISPPIIGMIADRYSLKAGFIFVSGAIVVGAILWAWASLYLKRDTERAPHLLDGDAGLPATARP